MDEREFTLAEAQRALDAIRADIEVLRGVQGELRAVKARLNALNRLHLNNGHLGDAQQRALRAEQRRLGEEASRRISAIHATGAVIKGIDDGLLDFPGMIEGIRGYWCWKAGEGAIAWWHPRGTGFADRRPIPDGAD
ncbi:MAG: DUF2203 domain-containing protein [Chloroflexi bacterium]|nr:DUF2203 domain-containing protein [Chloroflexota bacterium]MDA1145020.1 DUF2203 domain-containing protein [Chloroflexota bacterium]MQC82905.1 DUF2203 family protein [Chloroflexota bacterium]